MVTAIIIDRNDNVAMVTAPVESGQMISVVDSEQRLTALEPIAAGHKVALTRIEAGQYVIKYGIPIGRMTTAVNAGEWISVHNLEDTTEELCNLYCREFRDGIRTVKNSPDEPSRMRMINAYPRKDGAFGIRNHIMLIPTSPECNAAAEAISDATGCSWFVCDRTRLIDGIISDYTKMAMIYTGRNPNLFAILILSPLSAEELADEICDAIADTAKPVVKLSLDTNDIQHSVIEAVSIVGDLQTQALSMKRQPVSMEGFGLAVHCSGSDWTTEINGNAAVGAAADLIVSHGGRIFMTEWMEWSGSQHIMAEKCLSRELGLNLLDYLDSVRLRVLRETGRPVEFMNPAPLNKEAGLTTLVEKSTGTIRKIGSTPIQGILDYCQQPTGKGVWLPKNDSVWSPSTAIFASLCGAHMSVLNTGIGFLYFELPHIPCIRTTGNPVTFANEDFKLDFNAGIAFDKPLPIVADLLFDYLIKVAEGEELPKTESNLERAFHMYYYIENEFGDSPDRSRMLHVGVQNYHERRKLLTDLVK